MRQRAQALKDGASQALQAHRDLSASLQRARAEIQTLQGEQKELLQSKGELEAALAASQKELLSTRGSMSSVQQQLTLYTMALEETRRGSDLEQIRSVLRSVLENPAAEQALREEARQARDELKLAREEAQRACEEAELAREQSRRDQEEARRANEEARSAREEAGRAQEETRGLRLAFERSQTEIATLQNELRAREDMLDDKEREYLAIYGELDLTKSLVQEMRLGAESSERLLRQHQQTQELLRQKESTVRTLELELRSLLDDDERKTAELEALRQEKLGLEQRLQAGPNLTGASDEIESLRENVMLLEDQISDLEIVNSELYQRLAELESNLE